MNLLFSDQKEKNMLVRKIRKVLVIFKLMNSQAIHDGCHDGKKLRNADLSAHS